jgi:hypothetical protein
MNVIDLLIDHPSTPKGPGLKTLLPHRMTFLRHWEMKTSGGVNNGFCCLALQVSTKFDNPAIARVGNQMKVIGHQDIGDQFTGPLLVESPKLIEKSFAAVWLVKDW